MLPRKAPPVIAILLVISGLAAVWPIRAQVFDFQKNQIPLISLDGLWRFHPGDDPNWARAKFDDAYWPLVRSDKSWNEQGYAKLSGFAWYRAKVVIPAGESELSLYLPYVLTSYQVFADGALIGGFGGMPPHPHPVTQFVPASAYRLPHTPAAGSHTLVIAIRVWHWPGWESLLGGGIYEGARIGDTTLVENLSNTARNKNPMNHASDVLLALLEILAGLGSLGFFLVRPRETEYRWFMGAMFFAAASRLAVVSYVTGNLDTRVFNLILALLGAGFGLLQIGFFRRILGGNKDWLFWMAVGSVSANLLLALPTLVTRLVTPGIGGLSLVEWNAIAILLNIPLAVWILSLLFQRAVQGIFDARLLLAPVLLQQCASLTDSILWLGRFAWGWRRESYARFYTLSSSPFPFSVSDICDLLFLLGMFAIFVYRFTRTRRQEDEHNRELEAARAVQNVLVPEEIPHIQGFSIQSAYEPAGQVGGDFFQIILIPEGGVLIAIGDVSGKGIPAAMMVSLLVGTLRTVSEDTISPGEILARLNRRLQGRGRGGFTTCLVLCAHADGTVIVANAGHLAPYGNGKEIALEAGLPLGITAQTSYSESTLQLHEGDQITLVTDGVVEARSKKGELFGFDRTTSIAHNPAEFIARTAQDFGQNDDITVVTLTRLTLQHDAPTRVPTPALSPSAA